MKDFLEKYTRNSFKQKECLKDFERKLLEESLKEDFYLKRIDGTKYSHKDSLKVMHCMICDKCWINNSRRYCTPCEFYVAD